jgi:RHS repeat-associated protein
MVPAEAFEQVESVAVTDLHGQSLPLALPFGWSPLGAFHADLPGVALEDIALSLKLPQPISSAQVLVLAHFDSATTTWITRDVLTGNGSDLIEANMRQPGSYVLVMADALAEGNPALPVEDEPLPVGNAPVVVAEVSATGRVNPATAMASRDPAKVTATATVDFTNGAQALASGAWFLAEVEETYDLLDGRALKTPDYDATFYAYQFPGDSEPTTASAQFPLRPRILFGPDELSEAHIKVDVLALSNRSGGVITEQGGVLSLEGLQINVPADAVTSAAAEIRALPAAGLTRFLGGLTAVRAFDLNLPPLAQGAALEFVLRQRLVPSSFFVLARCVSSGVESGLQPVQRLASDAQGNVTSVEPASGARLSGLRGSGQYVLIQIAEAEGLITGTVRDVGGALLSGAMVRVVDEPWLSITGGDGLFATLGKPGERLVLATDPADGNNGEATATLANAVAHTVVEIQTAPTGPRIISSTPTNGQQKVVASTPILVRFSEPLDRASFGPEALTVTNPLGVQVIGTLTLNKAATEASFLPTNPLEHAAIYTVELAATIRDRQGLEIEGNRAFSFSVIPFFERPAGAQLVIYEPGADNVPEAVRSQLVGYSSAAGSSHVVAHGSAGTADPEVPVILVNQNTGATATVLSKPDGSFANFIDAAEEDFIEAVFVNANGTRVTVPATRQIYDNGKIGLYKYGGILEAESDGGPVQVLIEPEAIKERTVFKMDVVTVNQLAQLTGGVLPEGEAAALPGVQVTFEGDEPEGDAEVSVPIDPATLGLEPGLDAEAAAFALTVPVSVGGEVIYVTVDKMRYEDGRLFTNTCPFKGPYSGAIVDNVISFGGNFLGVGGSLAAGFGQMMIPIIVSKATGGVTVNGTVGQLPVSDVTFLTRQQKNQLALLPLQLFGGVRFAPLDLIGNVGDLFEEGFLSKAIPVAGALVAVRARDENFDGKIRPGLVCAISDDQGCYSMMVSGLGGKLVVTHPRLGRGTDVTLGAADMLAIGTKAFLSRNLFFGVDDGTFRNIRPRMAISHLPLLPAVDQETTLMADAFAGASAQVTMTLDRTATQVETAVLGQAVAVEDVQILTETQTLVAPGHHRLTVTLRSAKSLYARLQVRAVSTARNQTFDAVGTHTLAFGFSRPPVSGPLVASDPNDVTGPTVVSIQPREGTFLYPGDAVEVRFSEPIDPGVATEPGAVVFSHDIRIPGLELSRDQQTLRIRPQRLQTGGRTTLSLGMGIRDLAGNALAASVQADFFMGGFETAVISGVGQGGGSVLDGSVLYLLDRQSPGRVRVYDVSNPVQPRAIGGISALEVAARPGENASNALDFPRDAVLVRGWSHVPGLVGSAESPATTRTLLCVVGGFAGSIRVDEEGNDFQNGQFLTILDVSQPASPKLVRNVQITVRPSTVPKVRWDAPNLHYLENSADTHFVSRVDLQELLIGFSVPGPARENLLGEDRPGQDLNGDGDYTDPAEKRPFPNTKKVTEFMGFKIGYDVRPFPRQRVEDFDFANGVLAVARTMSGLTPPLPTTARPEFRIIEVAQEEMPPQAGFLAFEVGARPKRLALAPRIKVRTATTTEEKNLAFVSLSPDADGVQKLAVIDYSNASSPSLVRKLAFPDSLGLGVLQSPVLRTDGMLALATTSHTVLVDPTMVFAEGRDGELHPAVVSITAGGGSSNFSIGENELGMRVVALGGRNEITYGPPRLAFVGFPLAGSVVDPTALRVDAAAREAALEGMRETSSLRPARLRGLGGGAGNLSPPQAGVHYHVLVEAPGGSGVTLPILLESLNEAGAGLPNLGVDYPPVRAAEAAGLSAAKLAVTEEVDAPVRPLTAYRLSDDVNDPAYNLYLSDPVAVIREKVKPVELEALRNERKRAILWSENAVRATLDVTTAGFLGAFASEVDGVRGGFRPKVAVLASTLPGGYVPGGTPPPMGGGMAVPGTFGTIDAASGEFRHTTADISLPSRRMPIVFERTATSHALVSSGFGRGWDFNYNQRAIELKPELVPPGERVPVTERGGEGKDVVAKSADILFSDGSGNAILFENRGRSAPEGVANDPLVAQLRWSTAGGEFFLPAATQKGVFDLMYRYPSGEMVRLTPDGTLFSYRTDGRLTTIRDRYLGNQHVLDYNADGELVRIQDLSAVDGRPLRLGYFRLTEGAGFDWTVDKVAARASHAGKICTLVDFAGRRIDFEYDDAGMLVRRLGIEVAGENGGFAGRARTTYQIDAATRANVGVIAGSGAHGGGAGNAGTPLAVAATAANGRGEAVATGTQGAGGSVGIAVPADRSAATVGAGATTTSHADGSSTAMSFDANGYPAGVTMTGGGAAAASYQTVHNERGLPQTIVFPEGNSVVYEYEPDSAPFRARANVIKITRNPGPREGETLVSEAAYDHRYNLPAGVQKDFNGNSTTVTLRGDGRDVESTRYSKAGTHVITRNEFGQVTNETSVEGIASEIEYDAGSGYPTSTKVGTLTTGFGYNGSVAARLGVASSITPPRGAAIQLEHDARLQRTRMFRGAHEERFGYDENGNLVFASRSLGEGAPFVETREYTQINFLTKVTMRGVETEGGTADLVTSFTPDPSNRIKSMTLPGNEVRSFEYNHLGHITEQQTGSYKEEFGRDLNGNLTVLKKGGDIVEEWIYDGHDRPITQLIKTGTGGDEVINLTYFGTGETRSRVVSGPVGGTVAETLVEDVDELGRPLSVEAKGNQVNSLITLNYQRDGGRTVTATGPVDEFTSTHDSAGRRISQANSLRSVTLTPDENGNVTKVETTEDGTTYTVDMQYNELDHLEKSSDPIGTILEAASLRHDGLPLSVLDGRGNAVSKSYSRLGEVLRIDKPEQLRFAYAFTANRQPTSVKDRAEAGNVTAFDDGTLRPTRTTWRDGSSTTFDAPDGRNLPTSISIPGGSIAMSYDLQGRPNTANATYSGGNYRLENAQYDALGRLRSASYGSAAQHSLTMGYDKLGPLTSCTYNEPGGPYAVSSTIRADGARMTLVYPSGVTVTETRQASGRLQKVEVAGGLVWEATAFAGAEQPATVKRGDNITESCLYDARRRLVARRFTGPGNAMLEDMRLKYDGADNVVVRQFLAGGGRADAFAYDAANRLARADYGLRPVFQGAQRNGAAGLVSVEGFAAGLYARDYSYDAGGLDLLQGGSGINPEGLPLQTAEASALALPHFATEITGHDGFLFPRMVDGFARGAPDALGNTARSRLLIRPVSGLPQLVVTDLTYNAHSNLVRAQRGDGVVIDYQYRPDKLLHHRKVTGGATAGERALVWHEGRLLEEYDLSPAKVLVARYYYANEDPPVAADLRQSDGSLLRVHYFWDQVLSVVAVANEAGEILERVRYDAWGQPMITARDQARPRIAEVRRAGDDLLVVMSEPVLPPMNVPAGAELEPNNGNTAAQAFRLVTGSGEQTPQVVFEENAAGLPFGSVFRLTPAGVLSGNVTVRLVSGGLVDAWGNATQTEELSFTFGAGPVLASGAAGSTSPVAVSRSAIGNPWRWQGQWFDDEVGLVYMRARHYDPGTGQFLQRDPLQYEDSGNLYAGFRQNPVSWRDPTGTQVAKLFKSADKADEVVEVTKNTMAFARKQGLTDIEHQATINVLNRRLDKGEEVRLSIRGFGDKANARRELAEQGIQAKPSVISDKTGPDAAIRFTDTATGNQRVIASDLDALHLEINGRMASHAESMKFFGEINLEVFRLKQQLGKPAWPPFQHGAHTGVVHVYSPTHSKKFTASSYKLKGVEGGMVGTGQLVHNAKFIDDAFLTKVGHPGDSFTFKSSKAGGIEAFETPRWQTTQDIQTAERILMKHQADHGLPPVGFGESWFKWKE